MTILLTGVDGYMGWPTAMKLALRFPDEVIVGVDNGFRRLWVHEVGSWSAIPIYSMDERLQAFKEVFGQENIIYRHLDLRDYDVVKKLVEEYRPRAVVHLAAQPSAPYSMLSPRHAILTQENNVVSTLNIIHAIREVDPSIHLIETTTMGVYGTPNMDIPEGFFEVEFRGRRDKLPFPNQAASWYHYSKVHDANNLLFASRVYKIPITDLRLGVVYGTSTEETKKDPKLATRFDFDFWFGTLYNRFCAQAVAGYPLTVYGKGGQTRGYISLEDTAQTLVLAVEKPAEEGEFRVINMFVETVSVREAAEKVKAAGEKVGLEVEVMTVPPPRPEAQEHYYNPDNRRIFELLGLKPRYTMDKALSEDLEALMKVRERIVAKEDKFLPEHLRRTRG
ncbi:NAD-dependent dehydratase [Candidatus Bathyarchaeota archaeon]|nr:MAG: NAD-dependent dehydratase [Candidatus Bathyarchaeota archaeon]